jgi:threonine synthase
LFAAFRAGVEDLVPTAISATIAEGIASAKPTRVREVLRATRESGGGIVAVGEDEIVDALGTLAKTGLYVEPTSAAAAAGLRQRLRAGAISADQTTVLVLTGSGLKAAERIGQLLKLGARSE